MDNDHDVRVTGILKDVPHNTTLSFNFLVPFSYYSANADWVRRDLNNWRNCSFQTFVSLKPNVSIAKAGAQMKGFLKKYSPEDYASSKGEFFISPLSRWH